MQTFTTKSLVLGLSLALLGSTTAAFAQAGGPDTPSDAKMQGAKENGSSSVGEKGAMKSGSMSSMKKHHSKKMHHSM